MATTSTTSSRAKSTGRRTTGRKTRRSTARRRPANPAATTQKTGVARVSDLAERAALVPVGATLLARDNLVSTVRDLGTRYRTLASFERELKRYERRGATARNRFERQVRRTRTSVERQLRQRRNRVQRTVRQNRRHVIESPPAGQVLEAELVAVLQEHEPQVRLERDRRPPQRRVEEPPVRLEESRIVQHGVHRGEFRRHDQRLGRQQRLPQRRLIAYRSQHDGLDPY